MPTHSSIRAGRRRPVWAAAATGAMVASLLALTPGTAHADETTAPSLQWKISDYVANTGPSGQLSAHTTAEGATEAAGGVFTFPEGVGSYNPANGTTAITYAGSVTVGRDYGTQNYYVTLAHPRIVIDADGKGTLSADVSSTALQGTASSTTAARVTVVTFDGTSASQSLDGATGRQAITATPDWTGVLPADSQAATDLGIAAGKPIDGAAFSPAFLGQVVAGVRPFFYQSSAGQTTKAPAAFTAEADPIAVTPTITGANPTDGLSVQVAGTGFTGTTKSGDAGVYIGVAPAGGLPDVSTPEGAAAFSTFAWVPANGITNGAFTTDLPAIAADQLDPSTTYAVYTWQAHAHSNATQDTQTPLDIDFAALKPAEPVKSDSVVTVGGAKTSTYGRSATVTVTVPEATGDVTLKGAGAAQTKALSGGKVSFTLPAALAVGKHALTASYAGDSSFLAGQATGSVTVGKAAAKIATKVTTKATVKKKGKLRVTVTGVAGATKPAGKVTLTLTKGKAHKVVKATVRNGVVVVTLPKLAKGTWKVKAGYAGNASYKSVTKTVTVKVTK